MAEERRARKVTRDTHLADKARAARTSAAVAVWASDQAILLLAMLRVGGSDGSADAALDLTAGR